MKRSVVGILTLLALTACSKGQSVAHVAASATTVATTGLSVPTDLPDYVKIYPNAQITNVVDNAATGSVITFDVADPPDKVMTFYRKTATDAKLTAAGDYGNANGAVAMWAEAGTKRTLMATVDAKSGKTHVALAYGAK
jgi:hypothetical protein